MLLGRGEANSLPGSGVVLEESEQARKVGCILKKVLPSEQHQLLLLLL